MTAGKLSNRFYSPLVKTIAKEENVSFDELESIEGSGVGGRVQKKDIMAYLENRGSSAAQPEAKKESKPAAPAAPAVEKKVAPPVSVGAGDTVVEMDRVRKLIADHMVMSKQVSPHVTSVVEADVTELVMWRNKNKELSRKNMAIKLRLCQFSPRQLLLLWPNSQW